jgi:hypothetical protein
MHPEFSYRILEAAEMEPVATWTRHHHEHFDGTGYPFGLAAHDIPLGSRIVLVADAFESMTSDRIYRRALGMQQAVHELRTGAGHQFDPQVVDTMVALVEQGVFIQVMQQHGRAIEPVVDIASPQPELEPDVVHELHQPQGAPVADPTGAATETATEMPPARSDAEAWAMQQITDEQWAQPATGPAAQPAAGADWTQEQWDASQLQAAQEQAAFDAANAQAQQQADEPGFDPSQWAPPSPDDLAA